MTLIKRGEKGSPVSAVEYDGVVTQVDLNTVKSVANEASIGSISQGTGKAYATRSAAMAEDPLPANGVPFVVFNEVGHNGQYKFNSAATDDYDVIYLFLVVDETAEDGSENPVSSKDLFDKNNTLQTNIDAEQTARNLQIVNSQFIKNEDTAFIKELYLTGWDSQDIHLRRFDRAHQNDGLLYILFQDANNNDAVIFMTGLNSSQDIYELVENNGSGIGGYLVVDWSKYSGVFRESGAYNAPLNEKAKYLSNSPFIKAHIQGLIIDSKASNQDVTDEQDARVLGDFNNTEFSRSILNQQVWKSTAEHDDIEKYRKFILDIKNITGFEANEQYYLDRIARKNTDTNSNDYNEIEFRIKDSSNSILFGAFITLGTGIETHKIVGENHEAIITVDWREIQFMYNEDGFTAGSITRTPLENESLLAKNSLYKLSNQAYAFKTIVNIYKNWDFRESSTSFTNSSHSTISHSYAQNDGLTINIVDYDSGFKTFTSNQKYTMKAGQYYAVAVKYRVNSENMTDGIDNEIGVSDVFGNNGAGFNVVFNRGGRGATAVFGDQMIAGQNRTQAKIIQIQDDASFSKEYELLVFTSMTSLENKGIDLNYTIEEICLYALGSNDDFVAQFEDSNLSRFLESLNAKEIEKEKHFVNHAYTASNVLNFYTGKALFVYSASVWETLWQAKMIASRTGMIFNETIADDGITDGGTTYISTTLGGSQLTPVLTGANSKNTGDSHFSKVINTWEYYMTNYGSRKGNVVMLPFGYNHPFVNPNSLEMSPFINDGTAKEPLDFGINPITNPPFKGQSGNYSNFEFDLVADATIPMRTYDANGDATNSGVPSYGSCLRGVVEFILEKDPFCEIFIPTIYDVNPYTATTRPYFDAQIAVNIQVAKEYGFSAPRVDLRAGVNAINKRSILKDNIHPEKIVGERSALAVLASMGCV